MKKTGGVPQSELENLQKRIDVEKWLASEQAGRDLCGEASYCAFCDKALDFPCARALFRERGITEEIEAEAAVSSDTQSAIEAALSVDRAEEKLCEYDYVVRYRRSFKSKLIQSEKVQEFYSALKNAILGYAGIKCRTSFYYESFRVGKALFARMHVSGKTLCLYLALLPEQYDSGVYRFEDVSDKKSYKLIPMKLKISSMRAVKRAKELIKQLAARFDLPSVGNIGMDYRFSYASDAQLAEKGLIKPYTVARRKKTLS